MSNFAKPASFSQSEIDEIPEEPMAKAPKIFHLDFDIGIGERAFQNSRGYLPQKETSCFSFIFEAVRINAMLIIRNFIFLH